MLNIKNLNVTRNNIEILKNINWEIKQGEHWAILGANGSGKTTLLKIVAGMMWFTSGEVSVLGETFGRTDIRELRKRIGWVSNHLSEWIPPDEVALEVVLTGACSTFGFVENIKDEHHDKAHELLKSLKAENIYKSKYGVLSQGEKQKVLIARSMISNPELLIFDEPCSGLDIPSREHMLSTLNEIPQKYNNTTLILITHHIEEIVPVFNKVMILKDGEKFSAGDKKEILTKDILTPALGINLDVDKQAERYWLRVKH